MFSNLNKILIFLLLSVFFVVLQESYVWAAEQCEIITVDKSRPILKKKLTVSERKAYLASIPKGLPDRKKVGVFSEIAARDAIEAKNWGGVRRVSITTMFRNMNCHVEEYIRDNADRGLDDIFVVLKDDGWIDQRYHPIFHEAKYDGQCQLKLKRTATLCTQLSFQWLDGNLKKAYKRTGADLCYGGSEVVIKTCLECKTAFQDNVKWLAEKLMNGNFHRTASVLCPDGSLSIYKVKGS